MTPVRLAAPQVSELKTVLRLARDPLPVIRQLTGAAEVRVSPVLARDEAYVTAPVGVTHPRLLVLSPDLARGLPGLPEWL
jgi:hypothetical protein